MAQATTAKEVAGVYARCVASAKCAGMNTSAWRLTEGSALYGNSWAVVNVGEHGGQSTILRLGYTRREAYAGLVAMATAFELVAPTVEALRTKLANTENSLILATDHGLRAW